MPDIKLPYTPEGEELVENIKENVEEVGGEIDYGQNNVTDAPSMRENYQLGGLIPGQPGFGERPIVSPLGQNPIVKPPLSPIMEEGGEVPEYKKGGKV